MSSEDTIMETVHLIHNEGKHNKFWSYDIYNDYTVVCRWGRLGTKGQSNRKEFKSSWTAEDFATNKMGQKIRKGYKVVDDGQLKLAKIRGELVGPECKVVDLCFVEKESPTYYKKVNVSDHIALCNPDYDPLIFCKLRLTGNRGEYCLLIDTEKTYIISGKCPSWNKAVIIMDNLEEIADDSPKVIKKIGEKVPGIIESLIGVN